MAEILAPQKSVDISFSLEPAYNVIGSLSLLDMADDFSGLSDWVYQTQKALSPEQLHTNELVLQDAHVHLEDTSWSNFPTWVDALAEQDATILRDRALEVWLKGVRKKLDDEIPTSSEILANRAKYLSLVETFLSLKGSPFDPSFWEEIHGLLCDPSARQNLIVSHLRMMWDEFVSSEWDRNLSMLEDSIQAFESLDLSGLTAVEALNRVILRAQVPAESLGYLSQLEQIIFIPSAHTGPYMLQLGGLSKTTAYFLFGARIPEATSLHLPALSRSELLMRLSALANDTRLRILELLAKKGELGTPEIIAQLELSQSAGARHLEHLAATGFLITRQHQGTNLYQFKPDRIDYTFKALKEFCQ